MIKKTLILLLTMCSLFANAQNSILQRLQVNNSFNLTGYTVTGISNDTTGINQSASKLITEQAVKSFVINRFNTFTLSSFPFSSITGKPTTLAGYGITDNVTTQGNTFNAPDKLLLLNPAGALPAIDAGLITGITPSNIVQNSTHRFATDAEKSTWNAKQDALSGTGFVTISGSTISYDNTAYTPTSRTLTIGSGGSAIDLSANRTFLNNVPNIDATNMSNASSGTLSDARLSGNVNLLNSSQTITSDKVTTGLFTARANNIDSILDLSKGFVLENLTSSTITQQKRYSPAFVWKGQAFNAGFGGSGIANGNNEFQWKAELRASVDNANGGGASRTANNLVFSQKSGTNDWVDAVIFTKNGITAALDINSITLGRSGANGTILLKRSSDGGGNGAVSASSSGGVSITGNDVIIGSNSHITFTGNASLGMRYNNSTGLYITTSSNSNATPSSMLVVANGGASIGANSTAPTNGLIVSGRTRLTGLEAEIITVTSNYTVTETDHTVLVDATSGNITVTLRTAVGSKQKYFIKRIDNSGNSVTINTTSGQTIDRSTTYTGLTTQDATVQVHANGAAYFIISKF